MTLHGATSHIDGGRAVRQDRSTGTTEVAHLIPSDGGLMVVTHLPSGRPRGAVVVCSPLGWAFTRNYRREVLLARQMAAAGLAVQRFHPRGHGESGGSLHDTTFARLLSDAAAAADDLERQAQVPVTGVVGARLAALVALALSVDRQGASLVAWDPVVDGRSYVRDLFRLRNSWRLAAGGERESTDDELERTGELDVVGYRFSRAALDDLAAVDLDGAMAGGPAPRRALLAPIGPDASRVPRPVRTMGAALEAAGSEVGLAPAEGRFEWWLRSGFEGEESSPVGRQLIAATSGFLAGPQWAGAVPETGGARAPAASGPGAAPTARSDERPRTGSSGPTSEPIYFDAGDETLFGVVTEPATARRDVGVILLSGGDYQLTAGPFGVWAEVADRLAGMGLTSLRWSYRGVGESTGSIDDFDLRQPFTGELDAARRVLAERGLTRSYLAGRCFGARTACAGDTDGVAGVALVSLSVRGESLKASVRTRPDHVTPAGAGTVARRLARRDVLRLLADPGRRRRAVRRLRASMRHAVARRRGPAAVERSLPWLNVPLIDDLVRFADAGVPMVAIHGTGERADLQAARAGRLGGLLSNGQLREQVLDEANALYDPDGTARAVVDHIRLVVGPEPATTPGPDPEG